MKNLILTTLVFLLAFPLIMYSQAPGFLGKRASVMFNISSFPALGGPTQNNRGSIDNTFGERAGKYGINYAFEGSLSYATGRYVSLDIFAGQYFTGTTSDAVTKSFVPVGSSSSTIDRHYLFHRLNVRSLGIVFSKFNRRKGALAPIGNRLFVSLKRTFVKSEIVDKRTDYGNTLGEVIGHDLLNINEKIAFNFIHAGFSNTQILWNKVMFNVGVRVGHPLNLKYFLTILEGRSYHSDFEDNENQGRYEASVFNRLLRHEMIRIDIGVGYLLF